MVLPVLHREKKLIRGKVSFLALLLCLDGAIRVRNDAASVAERAGDPSSVSNAGAPNTSGGDHVVGSSKIVAKKLEEISSRSK